MNQSELEADYLLNCKGIIWLAEDVEEDVLMRITAQIAYLRAKDAEAPIHLYVRSQGGDSMTGMALANIIQRDGKVWGWLLGGAASSAATVWASCAKRLVFSSGRLGIHPVMWYEQAVKFDAAKAAKWAKELQTTDERQCEMYAAASEKDFHWWWDKYNQPGDMKWMSADELVKIGMAVKAEDQK